MRGAGNYVGRRSGGWRAYKTVISLLLVVVLGRLSCQQSISPETTFHRIRWMFVRGELAASQQLADGAANRLHWIDPEWAVRFRLLEAESALWRGRSQEAIDAASRTDSIPYASFGEQDLAVQKLSILGLAHVHVHQFPKAESELAQAQGLCDGSDTEACGELFRARGGLAFEKGDYEKGRVLFLRSLASAQKFGQRWDESVALMNLGAVCLNQERFDEARSWLTSAEEVALGLKAEDVLANTQGNLGMAYHKLGDSERALELYAKAVDASSSLGDTDSAITWLTAAGVANQDSGRFELAADSYHRALKLSKDIGSKEGVINSLVSLLYISIDQSHLTDATMYVDQVSPLLAVNGNHLDQLYLKLAKGRIASAEHSVQEAEDLFEEVEADSVSPISLRLVAEHELARLFNSVGRSQEADKAFMKALTAFEGARDELKQESSQLPFLANATRIYSDYIDFLIHLDKSDEALHIADQSRARTLAQGLVQAEKGETATPRMDPKAGLLSPEATARKAGATLLFYWLGEKQSYLWAITPEKTVLFQLPPQGEITAHVERYRKALTGPEDPLEAVNADGLALYSILVAPAVELLRNNAGRTVAVLTDGALSQLNFETLLVGGTHPHYWIEDATIVAAPSLAMLASAKPSHNASRKMLLIGDPVLTSAEYANLPNAAAEMQMIGRHFDAHEQLVLSRQRATPTAYLKSDPRQFAYIHFVSHGVASRTDPLDSAIILSSTHAGADVGEDAFKLYARDIMQSPLDASLVTISACYGSGARTFAGEGLVGLSWAFLRAGAHNTIGALWEASDDSTPRLMDALYQGLADGQTPAAALRNAKLSLLHAHGNFRKPYYWAPFQMYTRL